MKALKALACALALGTTIAPAVAQNYPTKPVRIVLPSPPGGGIDTLARLFSDRLARGLGQPVTVDNKGGGSGNIGTEYVARQSAPDGYTLLLNSDGIVTNTLVFRNLNYDPFKDFQPVSILTRNTWALVVTPKHPAQTLADLIRMAKANPGSIEYGSSGLGAPHHLAAEFFQSMAGIQLHHIPYKGSGQFIPAAISGEVKVVITNLPQLLPHIQSGKLRALGAWSEKRVAYAPEIPTMKEQGLPGAANAVGTWHGLFFPAGTPRPIVNRMQSEVVKALGDQEWVNTRLLAVGFEPVGSTPEELLTDMKLSLERWGKVVKDANIPMQ